MHPEILRQLATGHRRDLVTGAGEARRANEARRARRHRPPAQRGGQVDDGREPRRGNGTATLPAAEPRRDNPSADDKERLHIPVSHALVADFEAIAPRYPVVRACDLGGPLAAARPAATDQTPDQGE